MNDFIKSVILSVEKKLGVMIYPSFNIPYPMDSNVNVKQRQ